MPNYMSGCDENVSLVPEIDTFSLTSMNLTKTDKNFSPETWLYYHTLLSDSSIITSHTLSKQQCTRGFYTCLPLAALNHHNSAGVGLLRNHCF